jgi:YVTN family beta-propeller protein
MERWGVNEESPDQPLGPLSQAEASLSSRPESACARRRGVFVALLMASSLALVVGGSFHGWQKSASLDLSGTPRIAGKSQLGKLADRLLKSRSMFGSSDTKSSDKLEPSQATKMSGAPLSLPLFFEANRGQAESRVKFLARSSGYTLFITPNETIFAGARTTAPSGMLSQAGLSVSEPGPAILRMKLLQSNPGPEINGAKELPGKVNYLIGNNPRDWHTGVPLYEEVRSREVYPGIDLVFHGDQQRMEYDFQVAPGADPGRIRFKVAGAEKIEVAENGDLVLRAGKNEFRMRKPVMYQQDGASRLPVDGGYSLQAGKLVAFRLGAYDKGRALVIDPTIVFASFLGAAGVEVPSGMSLDVTNPSAPKLFVAGSTTDVTTFTETNSLIGTSGGAGDYAFVAKIDPKTTGAASLDFLTFIGGSLVFTGDTAPCQNFATDMKVDVSGGAGQVEPVVIGLTNCRDFPVTSGGPSTGTDDVFITRLTPTGAAIDNSTLFGGNGSEGITIGGGASLFLNPEGTIVLSGQTTSTNLPATLNVYSVSFNNGTPGGFDDCYVAKMDRSFNILYLTYLNVGGNTSSGSTATCGVGAIDAVGKIYVGGTIYSATAFNLINGGAGANGFQKTFVGTPGTTPNTFVAVLDPSQSGLNQVTYATYIAGGGGTAVHAGAVDLVHGMAVVVGDTISNSTTNAPDIPLLNAIQSVNNSPAGVGTGFITVMDTTKTGAASLLASSYFGGSTGAGSTSARSVAFDSVPGNPPTQRIVVGGQTTATNFPTMNPLQASLVGGQNAFVSVLSVPSSGSSFTMSLLFSTYLGGGVSVSGQSDSVRALVTDSNHAVYALGRTVSANFFGNTTPATTVNGFQAACASCGGGTPADDLVIFVLSPQGGTNLPDLTVTKSHSGSFSQGQSGAQYSITVTNSGTGATVGTVSLADSLPSSLTATAMTGTGWACSISTLVCTRSDALAGGASYPAITLTVNVAGNAPPSVTNTVTVSGGSETNTTNDTASDVTTINSSVGACTNNYIGLTNGSWGTAANWSKGAVPVSTDVVCIPSGITVLVNTALAAANQTISALNSSGTLTVSAGPLTVTNNSVANAINLSSGTLAFNGQLTVNGAFAQTGGIFAGTGEVDLNGAFTWSGGTICSTLSGTSCVAGTIAQLNANGGITFPSGTNTILSFRTLNSSGTATWSGTAGTIDMVNGSTISNLPSGIWNYANDSRVAFGGGNTVAFNNAGTFEKTGGTGTSTVGAPFHNTGTVLGNSGTLSFTGGGNCGSSCPGTFTAGAGATISFGGGIFAQSGPINGTGTLNFNGATMDFGTGVEVISTTTINITAGVLGGAAPGVVDFETQPNWSGGTICSSLTGASCATGNNGTTNMHAGINFPASSNVVLSFRTVNNNGTATLSGAAGSIDMVNGAVINNAATSVWNYTNDSVVAFGGGNTVAFNNAGTFEKTGGTGTSTFGAPFHNTGTVLGNSGTLSFSGGGNCGSTCSGMFTAGPGAAISFAGNVFGQSGPINGSGTVNFNGATMNFGTGTETISTTNVNFSAGVIAGAAPGILNFATPLKWSGGTMCSTLSGPSCISGSNATSNANAGINFLASSNVVLSFRTLNNNGTATWSGAAGSLDMVNGAIINNSATRVWNYTNDSILAFGGGNAVAFNNAGTFEKTGGAATTTIGLNFNNTGTVLGNSGTLSFTGGGNCGSTCSGMFTAGPGAAISFAGNVFGQSGPINGAGTVNFAGATMDFGTGTETISTSTINFTGGTLAGAAPGILNFSSALNWSGGTMCSTLNGGACVAGTNATTNANAGINFPSSSNVALSFRTLKNNGTTTWSGNAGSFDMINGSIVNNPLGSVWNYTNDSTLVFGGGAAIAFNNAGTFEKTGGTATSTIGLNFNNTGTVLGNSGTLAFTGGGNCGSTCAGTFTAGTGATIGFGGGIFAQSGPINGTGTVNFNGATMDFGTGTETISTASINFTVGTLGGAAPGILNFSTPLNWSGGTMCSSISGVSCVSGTNATTNANAGINFPSSSNVALSFRTLNNNGTTTWSGNVGSFDMINGSIVNNGVAAVWNYTNDSSLAFGGGAAVIFNNAGNFEKTGGTATTTIGMPFNNSGTVLANAANLSFTNTFAQTAGTTTLGGGTIQTSSVHPLTFQGGSFTGTGTVQGDVTNTGGSVAPGSTTNAGAISLSGSGLGVYAQSTTGAYNVKIGGTSAGQFDTLTMSGAATLGGPLNVSLINSFSPVLGNTFTILTAASVTGTFSTTNLPALSTGLGWQVTYNTTNVVLSVVTVSSPVANLNPGSLPFPNTIVNSAAAIQKVQLQNTGTLALTITSIVPTGTDAANYSYTPDATQPCPTSPATLGVGAICLLDIGFLPLTAGTHNNAQITVTDNSGNVVGSTQTVSLSGTGIVLNSIAVTPAPVTITQGSTQQFTATGTYSDSSTQNLTNAVTWASATTSVAAINATGLAQGVSPGTSNITAKQGSVTSPAAVLTVTGATHFAVSAPSIATAGNAITVTVTAQDQFNTTVPGYTGTVHLSSSDTQAVLPANSTLTRGSGSFQVTLKTLGSQTVTATDTVTTTITGTSNSITVGSGLTTHFQVSMPGFASVGTATSVNVVALDQFNNVVTTYAGTVHFTSTDASAVLPANSTLTSGVGTFPVTFRTAGSQTVTATDTVTATITGTSNTNLVSTGTATHLLVATLPSVTAGTPFTLAVEALDQFNNIVTSYTGTVHFTSTDASAVLPANSTLTSGVGSFQVTLKTTGSQTVTATDTVTATITGTSNTITVSSTTATHFLVTAPPSATAGTPVSVSVVALDQFSNLVTGYTGTVHFTSTDGAAVLPANSTLTSGTGVFSVTLKTAGGQTVTATDTVTSTINGTSNTITVGPIVATHLLISAPGAATAGTPFNIIVTALDQFNNIATGYTGTVHFTSTDGSAVLPTNVALTNGTNTLSVTLKTLGSQTITGTDTVTASITGTSNTITVSPGTATHFAVSTPAVATAGTQISVTVTALDQFNNQATGYAGTVHFTSSDAQAALPANSILASGTGTFQVTLKTAGIQSVTATDTVASTITGSASITVSSGVATHYVLTAPASETAGSAVSVTVKAVDAIGNVSTGYTGTVHFTSSDGSAVLPANSTLINGTGTFSVTLKTTGIQSVTATDTVTSTITGAANITVSAGTATHFSVTGPATIVAGTQFSITVTALDQFNNVALSYPGMVHITSSDAQALLPTNAFLGSGTGSFLMTLNTTGSQTVTATDTVTSTITGSVTITVSTAVATLQSITVTPANPSVATGGKETFIAIGHYSDGSMQNLTATVTWGSGTTGVATITAAGVATGVSAGTSTISATLGAVAGSTVLTVTATTAHAYIGDSVSANCCLDVIDISTNQIVKQIPITNINEPLGITPDQSRVYVPDNVGSVLDVIDTTTNTLVNTIPVGNGTTAVVINPNAKFGYVSDLNDGNVAVFNVATGAVVTTIPVGFASGWISITPDGAFVYASSAFDGRVAVINTSTNTLSTTLTLTAPAGQPAVGCVTGPTFNPEGTLGYFALLCSGNTPNGNTIDVLSIPSNALVATITVGTGPFQTVITPDGSRLYVANAVSNSISVVNTATNAVIATVPMPGHAESLAVTPDGTRVYVANSNAGTVSVIQTSTNTVTTSIATTAPFGIVIASPPVASAATTLTLTPANLVFGAQVDGTQSASQTISVKNPGATPVTLTSISLTGPNPGDFRLINGCPNPPATLGAGASCNLQISSDPTTNGQRTALVTINSTNGIASSTESAPLSGTGISLVSIAVTPASTSVIATNKVQFTATGTFSDNSTQDLTNSVIWTSSSTGIATINASGLATGVTAGGPITITATSGNTSGTAQLTVTPLVTFPLNVTLIGTGNGSVTDNLGSIKCVNTAGVISGTCSASYPTGTIVTLTETATQPSTFGGWLQACSGTGGCSVTMNSAQFVTASFVPPPQAVPVPLTPGTNVTGMAAYNCPSNPNPSPGNPCLDPNAHATSLTIGQVITPFTLTVVATEVPPTNGDGICTNGLTPSQDFDCRFKSFFTFQTKANGDTVVPLCDPYANGNCVVYSVFFQNPGQEPDPSMYVGPVNWNITFNNDTFVPPAPYTGSTPRLYYDPSGFVVPNSPYGTDCTTPMLIGNPGVPTNPAIFCQFVFDITTVIDPTKKVDFLIGGKTKVFSDAVVAFPPVFAPVVTVTTTPDAATVTAGSPIGFTIAVSNSAAATANSVTLNTPLPGGTNVNWTISPAYTGPGTCSITGAQGSQVLNCAFGTLSPSTNLSVHILSASSAAGTAISPSTVVVGSQQLLSIGSIVVQPIPVTFSGLTASQSIPAGTSSVTLSGVVGNGTQFAPSGETVSITINGVKQTATVGSNGAFSLQFPTAGIPASATPYPITYSYAGDSLLSVASNNSTSLTVTPLVTFPLNVTLIGTGNGSVTDNLGSIKCVNTAGVISGTCSASYPTGTIVTLTETATQPSTFGGWLQACSGTGGCSVTMNSAQFVTASFVPPPQAVPVPLTPGTNVTGMAAYNCPSNPNPSPGNPCLDPNAHATSLTIGQVITPFTLTVVATEVPPTNGDGICTNGLTPSQDFDCRFKSFFTFQTKANGDTVVPLCDPYANGNCVVYSVFFQNPGQEPDPSMYVGPVNWNITFNNDTFVPPAPYTGSTPRLYYDPSGFVVPNSPYGTDCTTPMLIGNPGVPTNPAIFCQFVFDITTVIDPTKKVDFLIGGKTKVFSDAVVAFPPVFAPVVTVTTTPDAATVTAGSPIGFTIAVSNSAAATANSVTLNTPLPGGTNVNWTISPAYTGPGTCSITGAQGSQVLNCAFGTLSPSTNLSVHILSASSAAGTAISPSTVVVGSQQLLSIGSIVVQPIPVTFSGLTASQSIPAGTSSVTLSGVVGNGTQFAPSGETVSITINGVKQTATVGGSGSFSLQFPTTGIPGSTTPYPITYSYGGDSLLSTTTNNSTTLTVVSPPAGVILSASQQSATIDASGNYVFTIRVTNSGGTAATAATIKTAVLTTVVGTTRLTTTSTTTLPVNLGNIGSLSSVTTTLTFPASAGPPNTVGAISLGFGFTGGSAGGSLRATLP